RGDRGAAPRDDHEVRQPRPRCPGAHAPGVRDRPRLIDANVEAMSSAHEKPAPKRDLPPGLRAQLDASSFQGPATFGMRPLLTEPEQLDEWQPDVAIVGAPWDDNTTNRPGARFGPRAMRANAYDPGTYHLDLQVEMFDHLEVVDYGDAI